MSVEQEMKEFGKMGDVPAINIVKWAKEVKCDNKTVNSTQLRKFYNAVRSVWDAQEVRTKGDIDALDEKSLARLIFLRPHLAYAHKKDKLTPQFVEVIDLAIQKIERKKDLYNFVKFFEAIIAYSR